VCERACPTGAIRGHEIDFIVEGDEGIVGIEVKLSATIDGGDVRSLHWLKEKLGDDCVNLVIVTTGTTAYRRTDGVAVVPLALLGP
jgi:predicted AAA+ superfamily ATPase